MLAHLLLTFRHRAGVRPYTSSCDFAEPCVFSKQSPPPGLCHLDAWLPNGRSPFSRSYGCNLPSSFNMVLSSALVYSTCPPVSVWGTVYMGSYFLEHLHSTINPIRRQFTAFVTSARFRNINLIPIDYAFRPRLRGRLTLRGLALRRNPWAFGESVSHTVYRYSCQHSHF